MQATSDKTGSVGFTQTGGTAAARGIANDLTNKTNGYNPYYQWGRKDAFRSKEYTAAPANETTLIYKAESVTIGTSIQNPTIFYNGGTNHNPYNASLYHNAWNATYTELAGNSTSNVDGLNKTVKTVYDPCPVGYTTPPANTFSIFGATLPVEGNSNYYTSNGKKLYFPYGGGRDYTGKLVYTATHCYSWYAVDGSAEYGRRLVVCEGEIIIACLDKNGHNSHGHSIRPVREN